MSGELPEMTRIGDAVRLVSGSYNNSNNLCCVFVCHKYHICHCYHRT